MTFILTYYRGINRIVQIEKTYRVNFTQNQSRYFGQINVDGLNFIAMDLLKIKATLNTNVNPDIAGTIILELEER